MSPSSCGNWRTTRWRREFGHLMVQNSGAPRAKLYVAMFEEVCERQAHLVAEWLRVGYGQG